MDPKGFDFTDEATRQAMGRALRTTYEVDTAMPDHLARLMQQLQQRLDARASGEADAVGNTIPATPA